MREEAWRLTLVDTQGHWLHFYIYKQERHHQIILGICQRSSDVVKVLTGITAVILGPIKRAIGVHLQVVSLPAI